MQIGWQRADNIDSGDLHQLADSLYADLSFAALDNFANSRRALAGGWRNEVDLRLQLGGDAELFEGLCRKMPLVPPLAGST